MHFLVSARHISNFKRMPTAISNAMGTITRAMCDTTSASIARDRCVCACNVARRRSASEEKGRGSDVCYSGVCRQCFGNVEFVMSGDLRVIFVVLPIE